MLIQVLEIYVVWHPKDMAGAAVADDLAEHFQCGAYASLLSGAVEVYVRSAPWRDGDADDAPRPITWPGTAAHHDGPAPAQFVAVVPLIGLKMARAVERAGSPWHAYFTDVAAAQARDADHVRLFPMRLGKPQDGRLRSMIAANQYLAEPDPNALVAEPLPAVRRRDLAQGIAQWASPVTGERLRIFISHTKRQGTPNEPVGELVNAVRAVLDSGRVASFFDARELQPGEDWDRALREEAATSALLAVRTDLYASREWCQREMLTAKEHGMPVVVLEALTEGETRGSFLMDHTPRIPVRRKASGGWDETGILRAVNLLADAWLHRVLWLRQRAISRSGEAGRYWWAPQAPEPSTLTAWLPELRGSCGDGPDGALRILHPDPPLAAEERLVLHRIATLAGHGALDLSTPRLLSARGAGAEPPTAPSGGAGPTASSTTLLSAAALRGQRVGISVSNSADLQRLGLLPAHFKVALRELARTVLLSGGTLAYGGHLIAGGFTEYLMGELQQYAREGTVASDGSATGPALLVCLAHQEHRRWSLAELQAAEDALGLYGEMRYLDLDGQTLDDHATGRSAEGIPYPTDPAVLARGLTSLRRHMTDCTSARMLLGGKREGYTGKMPGVLEETLLAVQAGQPLYIAAGFGGVTLDIAKALDGRCSALCPQPGAPDEATRAGLNELQGLARRSGWDLLNNGLGPEENLQLALTHRPAEIAALVGLGLGRWTQARPSPA